MTRFPSVQFQTDKLLRKHQRTFSSLPTARSGVGAATEAARGIDKAGARAEATTGARAETGSLRRGKLGGLVKMSSEGLRAIYGAAAGGSAGGRRERHAVHPPIRTAV